MLLGICEGSFVKRVLIGLALLIGLVVLAYGSYKVLGLVEGII